MQRAISAVAAAAKQVTQGKGLVMAFYGYLNELGGHRIAASAWALVRSNLQQSKIASPSFRPSDKCRSQ